MRWSVGSLGPAALALLVCLIPGQAWAAGAQAPDESCALATGERSAQDDSGRIVWSREIPLVWADFEGKPPVRAAEASGSCVGFAVLWECPGGELTFEVKATFDPAESWVKPGAQDPGLLRHEQLHFDLTELFARRLRKRFTDLRDPCKNPRDTRQVLDRAVADTYGEWQEAQSRYDAETRSGTDAATQRVWERKTGQDLEALEAFGPGR